MELIISLENKHNLCFQAKKKCDDDAPQDACVPSNCVHALVM